MAGRITHSQFFTAAEFVRENRETIEQEKFNKQQACNYVSKNLGFTLPVFTLAEIAKSLGDEAPLFHSPGHLAGRIASMTPLQQEIERYLRDNGPTVEGKIADIFITENRERFREALRDGRGLYWQLWGGKWGVLQA